VCCMDFAFCTTLNLPLPAISSTLAETAAGLRIRVFLPLLLLLLLQVLWLRLPVPSRPAGLRPACAGPGLRHGTRLLRVRSAGRTEGLCHR
jgi:hypothetical protein